jgi:lauroyl/myristoyl acyltransferase
MAARHAGGRTPPLAKFAGLRHDPAAGWHGSQDLLRALRHWVTARATDTALWAAPRLSVRGVDRIGALVARCGPHSPIIARQVAENLRAVGVYSPAAVRDYFAQLGEHFSGALHALRCASRAGPGELAALAAERVELDDSVARLSTVLATGRGAILVGPHINNYLLNLARLNQVCPLTVYLRHSKDAQRRAAKQRWYEASGVGWISEPLDAGRTLGRLGRMAEALRAGRVLFITPDLPQKRESGTPVQFFGREIYLPAGPALLALRSGAPLFMLTAEMHGSRQRLVLHGPFVGDSETRGRDQRQAAVRARLQWFADGLERFLVEQTPLWYLWGDKRWTRLLRGDSRYVRKLDFSTVAGLPEAV